MSMPFCVVEHAARLTAGRQVVPRQRAGLRPAVIEIVLFVAGLFGVPLILKALLPPPSGSLSSFLIAFLPTVWSPTVLAMAFVAARDGLAD
jgi:hypothetical protein